MSKKVLVVDDNNIFSRILKDELELFGHETLTVSDGADAILRYLDNDIDIVVLDIKMPKISGVDTLQIIRKINPKAKVIIITGNPTQDVRNQSIDLGAINFLTKPFPLRSLIQIIQAVKENGSNELAET